MIDISSYSKFEVSGTGARAWLDALLASTLPAPGRGRLAVMLSERGATIGDFTLFCLPVPFGGGERFVLTGSGPIQEWHMRWFHNHLPADGVVLRNVTDELMGLAVVGPHSREILQRLTPRDLSADAFRFMSVAEMEIGRAPAIVDRVSLTGELGFEVWVPPMYHRGLYTQLMEAGADVGVGNVGALALLSMRLEKGFGIWGREFSPDYRPHQNDMRHFVSTDKPSFVGRDALLADQASGATSRLVMLEVDATTSDASGFEPVYLGDRSVGYVTSGGFGHRTQRSLVLAYIEQADLSLDATYEVPLVGVRHTARLLSEPPFDPAGVRMRS